MASKKNKKRELKEGLKEIIIDESQQGRNLKLLLEKLRSRKERKVDEKIIANLRDPLNTGVVDLD